MHEVHLDRPPVVNDFREGFFPRRFHYKRDAQALVDEVGRKGGLAHIEPVRKPSRKALARHYSRIADRIDGYDRDDLGESPDF